MSIDQQNVPQERNPAECLTRRPLKGFLIPYPESMNLQLGSEKEDRFARPDSPHPCDLLDELVEEIEVDWPAFLPVERVASGIMQIALGWLLFAGLVVFCVYHLKAQLADSLAKEREPSARVIMERVPVAAK
jgi:hypothetical protein